MTELEAIFQRRGCIFWFRECLWNGTHVDVKELSYSAPCTVLHITSAPMHLFQLKAVYFCFSVIQWVSVAPGRSRWLWIKLWSSRLPTNEFLLCWKLPVELPEFSSTSCCQAKEHISFHFRINDTNARRSRTKCSGPGLNKTLCKRPDGNRDSSSELLDEALCHGLNLNQRQ